MNWVDYVIIVLVAGAAFHGWRRGAVVQLLSVGGFWLGLFVGVLVAPPLAGLASGLARVVIALVVVVLCGTLLGAVGEVVGSRAGRGLRRIHLGPLDEGLGVAVGVAGALLAVWLVGTLLAASSLSPLDQAVQRSRILRSIDEALPTLPSVFARVEAFLSQQGFPVVFIDLPPELLPPAAPPTTADLQAAAQVAAPSTVKVIGPACGSIVEGSGFVVAPQLVVTNAHVVAGDTRPQVVDAAGSHAATAIGFDPQLDVAVLDVPGLTDAPLEVHAAAVGRGTQGAVLGYPENGGLRVVGAAVNATFEATGLDIYGNAVVTRQVYELHAVVLPGNSGGPLVTAGTNADGIAPGTVIGLVFARSTSDAEVGYALTMGAVETQVQQAEASRAAVSTGSCVG